MQLGFYYKKRLLEDFSAPEMIRKSTSFFYFLIAMCIGQWAFEIFQTAAIIGKFALSTVIDVSIWNYVFIMPFVLFLKATSSKLHRGQYFVGCFLKIASLIAILVFAFLGKETWIPALFGPLIAIFVLAFFFADKINEFV